jgi:hypothetical protein
MVTMRVLHIVEAHSPTQNRPHRSGTERASSHKPRPEQRIDWRREGRDLVLEHRVRLQVGSPRLTAGVVVTRVTIETLAACRSTPKSVRRTVDA